MSAAYAVASCGVDAAPLPAHPAHQQVIRLPSPLAEDFLPLAFSELGAHAVGTAVLVVHSSRGDNRNNPMVMRALARHHRVVSVALTGPPTQVAATSTWLASLAQRGVPAGVAVANLVADAAPSLRTRVVTSSASVIPHAGITVGQQILSWLPGVVLAGSLGPQTAQFSLGRSQEAKNVAAADQVVAGDDRLASRLGSEGGTRVAMGVVDPAAAWWSRGRHYEETSVPRDVDAAVARLSAIAYGRCPECRESVVGHCLFCVAREEGLA